MSKAIQYSTPEDAQNAFYQAFEQADPNAMMQVWDESADVLCVHPMAQALHGRDAVAMSWHEIFQGGADMRFTIETIERYTMQELVVFIVYEHIAISSGKPVAPMVATNIYRQCEDGWRMVMHQAGPAPSPAMYQSNSGLH